jgi:hypothetical protein
LTRKIARQSTNAIRMPPSTGPMTIPIETAAQTKPNALPRSACGNAPTRMEDARATIIVPPTACSTRQAIRTSIEGARPHNTEATVKVASPKM